jgi:hypothetical protein
MYTCFYHDEHCILFLHDPVDVSKDENSSQVLKTNIILLGVEFCVYVHLHFFYMIFTISHTLDLFT